MNDIEYDELSNMTDHEITQMLEHELADNRKVLEEIKDHERSKTTDGYKMHRADVVMGLRMFADVLEDEEYTDIMTCKYKYNRQEGVQHILINISYKEKRHENKSESNGKREGVHQRVAV